MKRTKMIKEIVKLAKNWESSKLDKNFADELLSKIEKLGMLPPFSNEVFQKNAKIFTDPSGREWDNE